MIHNWRIRFTETSAYDKGKDDNIDLNELQFSLRDVLFKNYMNDNASYKTWQINVCVWVYILITLFDLATQRRSYFSFTLSRSSVSHMKLSRTISCCVV